MNELTGEYGCPRRFKFQRDLDHAKDVGEVPREHSPRISAHLACGTAAHETIARALNNPDVRDHVLRVPGRHIESLATYEGMAARVRTTFEHELRVACDGRELDWHDEAPDEMIAARVHMIVGVLGTMATHVQRVIAVEPGFIVELDGVTYSGHVDLVFEPRSVGGGGGTGGVAIADWKTGGTKPDTIELEHGWEPGIYAAACLHGVFLPREAVRLTGFDIGWTGEVRFADGSESTVLRPSRWEAERVALESTLKHIADGAAHPDTFTLGVYPSRVYHVHMRDFVPYEKSGTKTAKRPEDLEHYGLTSEAKVKYTAGEIRGPGWIPIASHENNVTRLAYRARNVIGTVRMGRFVDLVREHCRRCPFKAECLTGGYALRGDELAALESELKKAGL